MAQLPVRRRSRWLCALAALAFAASATALPAAAQDLPDLDEAFGELRPGGQRYRDPPLRTVRPVSVYHVLADRFVRGVSVRAEVKSCCPTCFTPDGRHYYDSLRTMNLSVGDECASRVPVGRETAVSFRLEQLCRRRPILP